MSLLKDKLTNLLLHEQLRRQRRSNLEMKQMLQNQVLAIDAFQHKRQLAGQEAQSFVQCRRKNSEDFVRCELAAVERFESTLQKECDAQLHHRTLALQNKCWDHVAGELKTRAEFQQALQHESALCIQSTQSLEASLDQRDHESLHHAEREQRFVTEAQQEIALQILRRLIQGLLRSTNMVTSTKNSTTRYTANTEAIGLLEHLILYPCNPSTSLGRAIGGAAGKLDGLLSTW